MSMVSERGLSLLRLVMIFCHRPVFCSLGPLVNVPGVVTGGPDFGVSKSCFWCSTCSGAFFNADRSTCEVLGLKISERWIYT